MQDLILVIGLAAAFAFGGYVAKKIDVFLNDNYRGQDTDPISFDEEKQYNTKKAQLAASSDGRNTDGRTETGSGSALESDSK